MKTLLTLLLQFLHLLLYAQDFSLYQKKEFAGSNGKILPYRILYPENYDRSKKYPVVLFLHGAGERGTDNVSQLHHVAGVFLKKENRANYPCIVIAPQCPEKDFWCAVNIDESVRPSGFVFDYTRPITSPLQLTYELVGRIMKDGSVDAKRVYIAGLSMGAMGTYELVYRHPELFAAAIPVCGGADVKAYDQRVASIPFRIFHGANDDVVSPDYSRNIVNRLTELHADVKYTEYPGVTHNSWDRAFGEEWVLGWLFSQKRLATSTSH